MRVGGSKAKGSAWERNVCRKLSLLCSNNKRTDLFWRSAMSGGRARLQLNKDVINQTQAGDISSISELGHWLINTYTIEVKHYRDLQLASGFLNNTGFLHDFWYKLKDDCRGSGKLPLMIAKQNNRPTMMLTLPGKSPTTNSPLLTLHTWLAELHLFDELEQVLDVSNNNRGHTLERPPPRRVTLGLLDWLAEQQADELIILGDLTVAKNNHPARMVNRLVDGFRKLSQHYKHIYILKGNHDYVDPNCPFFGFLTHLYNTLFIHDVMSLQLTIGNWLFMPAGTDWAEHKELLWDRSIFAHVSFDGALSETGYQLTGVSPHIVTDAKARVISGDVHKPQYLANGAIEYVGAPYHCHFGDDFNPRILLMANDGSRSELHYPAPRKFSQVITSLADLDRIKIKTGDQIKIIAEMRRADLPDWKQWRDAIREQAEHEGWVLFGPELKLINEVSTDKTSTSTRQSNEQLIADYTTRQKASELHLRIGQELLKAAKG